MADRHLRIYYTRKEKNKGVNMREDCIYFCNVRVRYGEVDQQGIVYNGHYGSYADLAFCEFLREKGYKYSDLSCKYDSEICHRKSTYEFFGSAYADDLVEVGLKVVQIGNRSFTIGFEFRRAGEEELIVYSEVVFVGYDTETRTSTPLTPLLKGILSDSA